MRFSTAVVLAVVSASTLPALSLPLQYIDEDLLARDVSPLDLYIDHGLTPFESSDPTRRYSTGVMTEEEYGLLSPGFRQNLQGRDTQDLHELFARFGKSGGAIKPVPKPTVAPAPVVPKPVTPKPPVVQPPIVAPAPAPAAAVPPTSIQDRINSGLQAVDAAVRIGAGINGAIQDTRQADIAQSNLDLQRSLLAPQPTGAASSSTVPAPTGAPVAQRRARFARADEDEDLIRLFIRQSRARPKPAPKPTAPKPAAAPPVVAPAFGSSTLDRVNGALDALGHITNIGAGITGIQSDIRQGDISQAQLDLQRSLLAAQPTGTPAPPSQRRSDMYWSQLVARNPELDARFKFNFGSSKPGSVTPKLPKTPSSGNGLNTANAILQGGATVVNIANGINGIVQGQRQQDIANQNLLLQQSLLAAQAASTAAPAQRRADWYYH